MVKLIFILLCILAIKPLKAQDTIPPVITLKGDSFMLLGIFEKFNDPGITVSDNVDTVVTYDTVGNNNSGGYYRAFPDGKATLLGTWSIVYRAKDKVGNMDSATRYIWVVDTIPPTIFYYKALECIWKDSVYDHYDAFHYGDNYDPISDITLRSEGCFDEKKAGTYKLRLIAADKSGNVSTTSWHYVIVKKHGDPSPCTLQDSLKDTCQRFASGFADEVIAKELKIYPNPAKDIFYLYRDGNGSALLRVYNITGKLCLEKKIAGTGIKEIEIGHLPEGVYLVQVRSSGGNAVQKLVIRR